MQQLYYFTGGGKAHQHYIDTILGDVEIQNFRDLITSEQKKELENIYENQPIKVWGATPGPSNEKNWDRLQVDDIVLVYKDKFFTHVGLVSYKVRNRALAERFWGEDEDGETWEFMYFLKDVSEVDIPVQSFCLTLGYAPNWTPQGFSRVKPDRLKAIVAQYSSTGEFINALTGEEFELDAVIDDVISFHHAEELPNEEERAESEVEDKAERIFEGLSEEQKKKRAWDILRKLKSKSKEGIKRKGKFVATRYERGPAGRAMKEVYNYRCMVEGCGFTFMKKNGEFYAEAHHLEALSDGGLDDPSNIVVLCPNHHRQFHYATVEKISRSDRSLIVEINEERAVLHFKTGNKV